MIKDGQVAEITFQHLPKKINMTYVLLFIRAVFALDRKSSETAEKIIQRDIARICHTFMVTCGMFNASGEFAINVGILLKAMYPVESLV
ncbi:hypothetical protein NCCP133_24770 [Cytobacillus sp. NCCP-133]|nr:hypothetical protein NCCP133_24770 [Cytobacillus sp. NCCP-133]